MLKPSLQNIKLANQHSCRFASFFFQLLSSIAPVGNLIGLTVVLCLPFYLPASLFAQTTFSATAANSIQRIGTIKDDDVPESSGLARSSLAESFWTLNDSANPAKLFLFSDSGKLLAKPNLKNAKNVDWEALTSFTFKNRPWLIIADVGDNLRSRKSYQLYFAIDPTGDWLDDSDKKVKKPLKKLKSIKTLKLDFRYEAPSTADNKPSKGSAIAKNCEAIAVDPTNNDIWLVEKVYLNRDRSIPPGIFRIQLPNSKLQQFLAKSTGQGGATKMSNSKVAGSLLAEQIGSFPVRNVTGMAFSPDGNKLIIRNYLTAHLYLRSAEKNWQQTINETKPTVVGLPLQSQGEAVCFTADSKSLIVTSEGKRQPVWRVSLESYLNKQPKSPQIKN